VLEVSSPSGERVARAPVASAAWPRLRGLIGRRLAEGSGLFFPACSSVHTHFMSYPIDLVYLSGDDVIVKVVHALRPWRWSWGGRRAKHVLELPAGTAARLALQRGDALAMRGPEPATEAAAAEPAPVAAGHQP
jgi:hypothetical protein